MTVPKQTEQDARRLEILASVNPAAVGQQLADACHWAAERIGAKDETALDALAGRVQALDVELSIQQCTVSALSSRVGNIEQRNSSRTRGDL